LNLETDFTTQIINLPDDYEGKVIATLIAANTNTDTRKSVLYIHGYVDYFFQTHMAAKFLDQGYDFYALDLRKYGRSLLPHQHPNYCRSITEYFPEISIALKQIYEASNYKITLVGHSTGGLITSMYMNKGEQKGLVDSLILNSPFFEFNVPKLKRIVLPIVATFSVAVNKYSRLKGALSRVYSQSIYKGNFGEWDFNLAWKPIEGFPTYFAWIKAVSNAQKFIQTESNITVPVLVMHSSKSFVTKKFTPEAITADLVLNIEDIITIGEKLGPKVTLVSIKDGMHDLVLSKKDAREATFNNMFSWLNNLS